MLTPRRLRAALALTLVIGFAPSASAQEASRTEASGVDIGAPGNLPLDQLPACRPGPFNEGASDASNAPDPLSSRARVCKAEPTGSVLSTRGGGKVPPPSNVGYHFTGQTTTSELHWQGVRQAQRVVNPNVCHEVPPQSNPTDCFASGQSLDFVASWVMIVNAAGTDKFIQAGWSENSTAWTEFNGDVNGTNVRQIFSYATSDEEWHFFGQYDLVDGSEVSTAVRKTANSSFGWQYTTYVYWNGVWQALDSQWLDIPPSGGNKYLQTYVEVFVDDAGPVNSHPTWTNSGFYGARQRKRSWFHDAYGWVAYNQTDIYQNDVTPPYYAFGNNPTGTLDITVCSSSNRDSC